MEYDPKYMARAIQLACRGIPYAMPNPLVGAVIVDNHGSIIGEGYHRKCGEAHAEVNAISAVANPEQLKDSTIYVTLEPCAHYGRTGPCADLIVRMGIPRVVVGSRDPFSKVDGRGIERMRAAGIELEVGVMERECQAINAIFFTAHTQQRPYVMLKWAQSADGYMDVRRGADECPLAISSPLTRALSHRLRTIFAGIMIGSGTAIADCPSLDSRLWPGPSPRPIILDRRGRIVADDYPFGKRNPLVIRDDKPLAYILHDIYQQGINSVLVEGGPTLLASFIDAGLWDMARVETGLQCLGERGAAPAPSMGAREPDRVEQYGKQTVKYYSNNIFNHVKNL